MFTENRITVAARCNECCCEIETEISVFSLSSGKIRAVCPNCGKSALEITLSQDGKVRLLVPCVACPHPHPFTLSAETMFTKEIFLLQCSFTRLDICFMGEKSKVKEQLKKNGAELRAMMQESGDEYIDESDQALIETMRIIMSFIEECAENGKILCRCRNMKTAPGVELQIDYDSVTLICKECGRRLVLSVRDEELLDSFMELGVLALDDEEF